MNIFPEVTLSKTEMDIVGSNLSNSAVKKYFNMLAYNIGRDIVLSNKDPSMSSDQYVQALASLRGQLAVLNTLLEVEDTNSDN